MTMTITMMGEEAREEGGRGAVGCLGWCGLVLRYSVPTTPWPALVLAGGHGHVVGVRRALRARVDICVATDPTLTRLKVV